MDGSQTHDFISTNLDPGLLATPFSVQTNWHVLTGAAGSGKTTLINHLADEGFQTVPESGCEYVKQQLAEGRSFNEMVGSAYDEMCMASVQRRIELWLPASSIIFLNRALPDCITFSRFCGLDPDETLADCFQHRYASVFILDRLPVGQHVLRKDQEAANCLFDKWLVRDYGALGYDTIRVPACPPEQRLAFILDHLTAEGMLNS
jgi:predicted ATPase